VTFFTAPGVAIGQASPEKGYEYGLVAADVYTVCMYTERLQILVSPEQRKRLEAEAGRRGASVAALIREAVDEYLGATPLDQRLRAVEGIGGMRGRFLSPGELERLVEEERTGSAGR